MAASLQETSVYREVQAIMSEGAKPVTFFWTATIHANKKELEVFKVTERQVRRNYLNNCFDEIYVDLMLLDGDYIYDVEPYRDNLEITLTRSPLTEVTVSNLPDGEPETQRYRAIVMDAKSELLEGNRVTSVNQEIANRVKLRKCSFQLLDRVIDKLRATSGGGIFRNTTAAEVARTLLTQLSTNIRVDNEIAIKGVDMAPKFTESVRNHIAIPQHTNLCKIPAYLHEAYGIYGAGFWYYLQKGYWYMYPTYDLTRYSQCANTLTVINLPKDRLPGLERTYRQTKTQTLVLSTGETVYNDKSGYDIINKGNAVRFLDADVVTGNFVSVDGNKVMANLSKNIQECAVDNREQNNIRQSPVKISSNVLFEKSRMAARLGSFIQASWENARDDIVYPGMPVKYIYEVQGTVHELMGVVVGAEYFDQLNGPNLQATRHVCRAVLSLFVEKIVKVREDD